MSLQQAITLRLENEFDVAQFTVLVEGNHAILQISSNRFEGKSPVQRQQLVYTCVNDLIQSGELHAITIHATTPSE